MVDFGGMKDKAQDLASEHGDQIQEGIDKGGDALGDKIGHDKVDPLQDKLSGAVDSFGGDQQGEQAQQGEQGQQ